MDKIYSILKKWQSIFILFLSLSIIYWPLNDQWPFRSQLLPINHDSTLSVVGYFLSVIMTMLSWYLLTHLVIGLGKWMESMSLSKKWIAWIKFLIWSIAMSMMLGLWAQYGDTRIHYLSPVFIIGVMISFFYGFLIFYLNEDGLKKFISFISFERR